MKTKILLIIAVFFISAFAAGCNNSVDMKGFLEKMKGGSSNTDTEKKKEIRKSIFPNIKDQ